MEGLLRDYERPIVFVSGALILCFIPFFLFGLFGLMAKIPGADYTLACGFFCLLLGVAGLILPPLMLEQGLADRMVQIERILEGRK